MAIKIPKARYIDGDIDMTINATDITDREIYLSKYKGHLFCPEEGCPAKLHHLDMREHGGSMYFRTNNGKDNKHKDGCLMEVRYEGTTTYVIGTGETVEISNQHLRDTIERRCKAHFNKKKKNGTQNSASTKNNKPRVPRKPTTANPHATNISLNGEGTPETDENKSSSRILSRTSRELTVSDYGKPRCVDGIIDQVIIYNNYAQIRFKEYNEFETFIEIEESFKDNDSTAFALLNNLQQYIEKNNNLYTICIGRVKKKDEKIVIETYKELDIAFGQDYQILTVFLMTH